MRIHQFAACAFVHMKSLRQWPGSAGILPAVRGMLPRTFLRTRFVQVIRYRHSALSQSRPAKCRTLRAACSRSPVACAALILFPFVSFASDNPVTIGSKKFTESYVLGEIAKRTLNDSGIRTDHRQGMGGTIILWEALRGGQIDAYPEYTGTIAQEILKTDRPLTIQQIESALEKMSVGMTESLGFNNTYALVMRRDKTQRLGLRTISDLRKHPELKIGLTH